jgi:hypothetical protein
MNHKRVVLAMRLTGARPPTRAAIRLGSYDWDTAGRPRGIALWKKISNDPSWEVVRIPVAAVPLRRGVIVWSRGIVGGILCLAGAVWIAQGTGALHGGGMSGHGQYAILGAIVFFIGAALVVWAGRVRRERGRQSNL